MPITLTEVEKKILNRVIRQFLDSKKPTRRKELRDSFEDPGAIDRLASLGVLEATQGNNYLPTAIAFYLCGDPKVQASMKRGVRAVTHALLALIREKGDRVAPGDVEKRAPEFDKGLDEKAIRLGLYVAPELRLLQASQGKNDQQVDVIPTIINEYIYSKDPETLWDDFVRQREGPPQPIEEEPDDPRLTPDTQPAVYISYARGDEKWRTRIATRLSELGIRVWDELDPESDADQALRRREQSTVFILLLSIRYVDSEHIRRIEFPHIRSLSASRNAHIIYVVLDFCPWQPAFFLPQSRSTTIPQAGRILAEEDEEEVKDDLHTLARAVRNALGQLDRPGDFGELLLQAEEAEKKEDLKLAAAQYERALASATASRDESGEAQVLLRLGRLREADGEVQRPRDAYTRVRMIAANATPGSLLWEYAQEASSRLGHLRHVSPEMGDIEPDEERRRDRRGKEAETTDQSSLEQQADESIEISSISDVPAEKDSLGFKPYVDAISRFLLSLDTKPPLTLSIEGEWGSGKSSFMLQLRNSVVGQPPWTRFKNAWTGVEGADAQMPHTQPPTDAPVPKRMWEAIRKKRRLSVMFNPWRHDKEESLWAAFALEFLRQVSRKRFFLRRWWGSAKLFEAHYRWKKGWFEFIRAIGIWTVIVVLIIALPVEVLWKKPHWAEEMVVALSNRLNSSQNATNKTQTLSTGEKPLGENAKQKPGEKADTDSDALLRMLLLIGGDAAYVAVILTIWLKAKDIVGNPFEINLRKHLRSPDYEGRVGFVEQFHADFRKIVDAYAGKEKVFVFIDDLDRCEVPKAAELMKAINLLIADDPRLIFILGMDRDKVAAGLAVKYEKMLPYLAPQDIDTSKDSQGNRRLGLEFGHSFLQKFIQLPFRVPDPNPDSYEDFIRAISTPREPTGLPQSAPTQQADAERITPTSERPGEPEPSPPAPSSSPSPPPPSPAQVQERRRRELKFRGDSETVRAVACMIANSISRNPRRLKQFLNLFRLQAYIANETGLFDSGHRGEPPLTMEQLGKFVAISLWWPVLLSDFAEEPGLLERLETIAARGKPGDTFLDKDGEPLPENRWLREKRLGALLQFGLQKQRSALTLSNPTIYQLLSVCPQRVRPEVPVASQSFARS